MRCVVLLRIEYAVDTIAVEQASQQSLADHHMARWNNCQLLFPPAS